MSKDTEAPKKITKTTDVMTAAKLNTVNPNPEVIVPGEVAEIRFPHGSSFTARTAKMFIRLLDILGPEIVKSKTHEVRLSELNTLKVNNNIIKDNIAELQLTRVILTRNENEDDSGPILTDVKRRQKEKAGVLYLNFSETFRRVVSDSTYWAAISAKAIYLMEGKYSPWLYQIARLYCHREHNELRISFEDLRERLGANTKKSYVRWINFKNAVLEPAKAEINQLTEVTVDYVEHRKRGKVQEVTLIFLLKSAGQLAATRHEQNLTRLGRKARRNNQVEQVKAEISDGAEKLKKHTLKTISDPTDAWSYVKGQGFKRVDELEQIILKDDWVAVQYAVSVLHDRWREAEAKLSDPAAIAHYCVEFDLLFENHDIGFQPIPNFFKERYLAKSKSQRQKDLEESIKAGLEAEEAIWAAETEGDEG